MSHIAIVKALKKRNVHIEDSTYLCRDGEDSVHHIFTTCFVASVDILEIHDYVGLKDAD
ncbi:hypothetical protein HanIR_Chr03g0125071 [Helianthus annuus]|nr:hypothetical protein HanIR_Chr03g0125071 [Helianthus annuus]